MKTASTPPFAAIWAAPMLCFASSGAAATDRAETAASVALVQTAAVTVVSNAPLQIALLTATLMPAGTVAPVGLVLSASGGDPGEGGRAAGLVSSGGSPNGTITSGDAVSVNVGTVPGAAGGTSGVQVVIAQYN